MVASRGGSTRHWHVTFTVADRDGAADTARRLGGEVIATDAEWTRHAVVRDPWGATFTVRQFDPQLDT